MPDKMPSRRPPVKSPNYFADYQAAARNRSNTRKAWFTRVQIEASAKAVTLPELVFMRLDGEALIAAIPLTRRFVEIEQVSARRWSS